MKLSEILRLVWINLIQNKFKVVLTSIGIVVGAATIVMVIAIGRGGQMDVADQFKNLNAGAIDISYEQSTDSSSSNSKGSSKSGSTNKSSGGTIDIKFLLGTTDEYYTDDTKTTKATAKRAKSATEEVDTTTDYYVHPAFTNESSIGYANGGWDKELTGIWVAKFEAGYASGNNSAEVKASSVNYSQTTAWVAAVEAGTQQDSTTVLRSFLKPRKGLYKYY